nr:MAG TPA: hypothetical protein [Caudoviricetes sp.]
MYSQVYLHILCLYLFIDVFNFTFCVKYIYKDGEYNCLEID